jgi:hypothetical protein
MPRTEQHRQIDASVADVWAILVDVSRLPEISPSTVHVEAPPRLKKVGDEFEQTVRLAGRKFTSTWSVARFEPETCLEVSGSVLPGTHYTMTEELEARGRGHTTMRLTIDYSLPFGPVGRLAGKLGAERKALSEAADVLDGIARLAESTPARPRRST